MNCCRIFVSFWEYENWVYWMLSGYLPTSNTLKMLGGFAQVWKETARAARAIKNRLLTGLKSLSFWGSETIHFGGAIATWVDFNLNRASRENDDEHIWTYNMTYEILSVFYANPRFRWKRSLTSRIDLVRVAPQGIDRWTMMNMLA